MPDAIRLPQPMTSDQAILRTTLAAGLVEAARVEPRCRQPTRSRSSSSRSVYLPSGEQLPEERWRVGGHRRGRLRGRAGRVEALYAALKLELASRSEASTTRFIPGKAARCDRGGWLGELHPTLLDGTWGAFELDLETLTMSVPERIVYEDVITFPANLQDIAVVVDERRRGRRARRRRARGGGDELREARVFDVYEGDQVGEGRKSVAIHLAFQSPERTLTDEESRRFASASSRRSPTRSAPSCAPEQDRPIRGRRRIPLHVASGEETCRSSRDCTAGALAAAGVAYAATLGDEAQGERGVHAPTAERSSMARGAPVTNLDPGPVELEIEDSTEVHSFHLTGPGNVNVGTGVEDIETKKFAADPRATVATSSSATRTR